MAIVSSPFGRTILSGEDAKQFIKQMDTTKPSDKVKAAIARGRQTQEKMDKFLNNQK
ncbi:hypothetical protein [Limnobaculum parvum]|uniref:hypothetical protein n=1 Tax=Limnobaculum parvum TaxID=2172103 RepID=UPI001865260B|nr:hypothetical protein [Limnobaculum parvum]